jgi:hypothetical protein
VDCESLAVPSGQLRLAGGEFVGHPTVGQGGRPHEYGSSAQVPPGLYRVAAYRSDWRSWDPVSQSLMRRLPRSARLPYRLTQVVIAAAAILTPLIATIVVMAGTRTAAYALLPAAVLMITFAVYLAKREFYQRVLRLAERLKQQHPDIVVDLTWLGPCDPDDFADESD